MELSAIEEVGLAMVQRACEPLTTRYIVTFVWLC